MAVLICCVIVIENHSKKIKMHGRGGFMVTDAHCSETEKLKEIHRTVIRHRRGERLIKSHFFSFFGTQAISGNGCSINIVV